MAILPDDLSAFLVLSLPVEKRLALKLVPNNRTVAHHPSTSISHTDPAAQQPHRSPTLPQLPAITMSTFNALPAELVHEIAKCLAPTCCEDSKCDILTFRSIERRTWLIGNQHAFKYMTLYSQNPINESRLGMFARLSEPASDGCNIQDLVREVRVIMGPEICTEWSSDTLPESYYRPKVHNNFLKMLGKKDDELSAEERVVGEQYWEVFIKPYLESSLTMDFDAVDLRIRIDLGRFTHLQTVYADLQHDVLESSNPAWKMMEEFGLADKIWNFDKGCFRSLENTDEPEGQRIDYHNNGFLGKLLVSGLPPSVSKLRWLDRDLEWGDLNDYGSQSLAQITEFDGEFPPLFATESAELYFATINSLPRLRTLHMRFGSSGVEGRHEFQSTDRESYPATFLQAYFVGLSLPSLQTLCLDSFVMSVSVFASLLRLAAKHNIVLNLKELVMLRSMPDRAPTCDEAGLAPIMADYWIQLLQNARFDHLEYVSSGRMTFVGSLKCVGVAKGADILGPLWEETLNQKCMEVLELFMRTGLGISEVRRVLKSEGQRRYRESASYPYNVLPEHERWHFG